MTTKPEGFKEFEEKQEKRGKEQRKFNEKQERRGKEQDKSGKEQRKFNERILNLVEKVIERIDNLVVRNNLNE